MSNPIHKYLYADEGDTVTAPMAAAIANHLAEEQNLDVTFGSAGMFTREGMDPDPLAVRALKEVCGIDMPPHKSRRLTPEVHREYDLHRSSVYRLNAMYNDCAHSWPTDGCFDIAKPVGKDYEAYKKLASKLYQDVVNQLERLKKEGRVLPR